MTPEAPKMPPLKWFAALLVLALASCGDLSRVDEAAPAVLEDRAPAAAPVQASEVSPRPETGAAPVEIVVAFWNIQWFPGMVPEPTAEAEALQIAVVQAELAEISPDVLGMSEIRDTAAAQLAIAKLPRLTVNVCSEFPAPPDRAGTQQLVIASRLEALSGWVEAWKPANPPPPRGFAFAALRVNPKHLLLVYSVHFKSNWGQQRNNFAMREESARQVIAHAERMKAEYKEAGEVTVLVFGDFNTSLDDENFRNERTLQQFLDAGFRWGWEGVPFRERLTIPASGPFRSNCFDHAFVKGAAEVLSAQMPRTSHQSSDHRPVVLTLRFP